MAKPAAQAKLTSRIKLNLLYPQGIPQRLPIKFLKWLISYGRFIVVVVELIVLACFVYRFKLDADLNSLKEQINSKVPFLENASKTDEAEIKLTQNKLSQIKKSFADAPIWQKTLDKISAQIPVTTRLSTINLGLIPGSNLTFKLSARTSSNIDVSAFVANLKKDPELTDINLSSISLDQGEINFSVTGAVK